MKKKAKAKKVAAKKPAVPPRAAKTSGKKSVAPARSARTSAQGPAPARTAARYTPQEIQGTGWAPFRYPPQ